MAARKTADALKLKKTQDFLLIAAEAKAAEPMKQIAEETFDSLYYSI